MQEQGSIDPSASDGLSVAPPPPGDEGGHATPEVREGMDAENHRGLKRNPADDQAKLDVALDETFPNSDAPSNTQPGKGKDPAPSSGYDEEAEAARQVGGD